VTRAIYETYNSQKGWLTAAQLFATRLCCVAIRRRAIWTFVKGSIGVADFDRDAPSKLFTMRTRPDSRYRLNKSGFPMVNMSRSTDIDFWLAWDFPSEGFSLNCSHVEVAIFASCKYKLLGKEHFGEKQSRN
jgi:hypothetical protein